MLAYYLLAEDEDFTFTVIVHNIVMFRRPGVMW